VTAGEPAFLHPLPKGADGSRPDAREVAGRSEVADDVAGGGEPRVAGVLRRRAGAHPEEFGVEGEKPSHPELLDWLACEFMSPTSASGGRKPPEWSLKHLHRLIVTSATYKQSSKVTPRR
jgi:hypothetical protein